VTIPSLCNFRWAEIWINTVEIDAEVIDPPISDRVGKVSDESLPAALVESLYAYRRNCVKDCETMKEHAEEEYVPERYQERPHHLACKHCSE
jgi:hypothetical protein